MINQGYKGFGSGMLFHPFSLGNPSYFKNLLSEQPNLQEVSILSHNIFYY
jgi:hypothetical protein